MIAVAVLPLLSHGFIITLMNYIGIYTLITLGLVLLTGCGGITSFGQAAFVGIGAYATAYLTTAMGWSPWLGLLAGIVLTSFVALVLGYITLHLGGHYLPLTTIAWGMAIYLSFGNFAVRSARMAASRDIPSISLFGFQFDEPQQALLRHLDVLRRCAAWRRQSAAARGRAAPSARCAAARACRKASASMCSGCGSACSSWRPHSPASPAGFTRT